MKEKKKKKEKKQNKTNNQKKTKKQNKQKQKTKKQQKKHIHIQNRSQSLMYNEISRQVSRILVIILTKYKFYFQVPVSPEPAASFQEWKCFRNMFIRCLEHRTTHWHIQVRDACIVFILSLQSIKFWNVYIVAIYWKHAMD